MQIHLPNPLLRHFDLIDTPGLASFYQTDAANALRVMGIEEGETQASQQFIQEHGDELDRMTQEQAETADAVVYLFSDEPTREDERNLRRFLGPLIQQSNPLTAVGVLSKIDMAWNYETNFAANTDTGSIEPLLRGRRKAAELSETPLMRHRLYAINPVCGQLACGAQALTEEEDGWLRELAALPLDRVKSRVCRPDWFMARDYADMPTPAPARAQLLRRLGQYGIWQACSRIQEQPTVTRTQLQLCLLEDSGVPALRALLLSHFGRRATLIKLEAACQNVRTVCARARATASSGERVSIDAVADRMTRLQRLQPLQELNLLHRYYQGTMLLPDLHVQQLLQITGEHGTSCAARLGLPEEATLEQMIAQARQRVSHWRRRQEDSLLGLRDQMEAAHLLRQSFESLLFQLEQTRCFLENPALYNVIHLTTSA